MALNLIADALGILFVAELITIFVMFWKLMGITQALLRLFSTMLVSIMVYFFLFIILFYINNITVEGLVYAFVLGGTSYVMYKSHKEHKEELQKEPGEKFETQKI